MKVWITKYALTQGIFEKECQYRGDGMIMDELNTCYHGEGKDWHRTKESAVKRAEEMRQKKIQSLQKKIKKLEDMKFD